MKDDTISRAAAIDAMMKLQAEDIEAYGASIPEGFDGDRAVTAIKALPSAQLAQDLPNGCTDTISRQAAIDALDVLCQEHRYKIPGKRETYSQYNEAWQDALDRAEGAIGNLPSAQPGQRNARVFQGIVVEYPSISAYPEYEGKPYFSIKYTENGQEFIGYGTYKPEVLSEYLKEYFMPPAQPGWIPVTERLPKEDGRYLVSVRILHEYNKVMISRFDNGEFWDSDVVAWMPLPKPYREGGQS